MDFHFLVLGIPFGFTSATSTLVIWGYPFIVGADSLLLFIASSFTIGFVWFTSKPRGRKRWL